MSKAKLSSIVVRFVEEVLPFLTAYFRARHLQRRIDAEDIVIKTRNATSWLALSTETLDDLLKEEADRRKSIEDKTAKLATIIAVALTIGSTFSASVAANYGGDLKSWWGGLLALSSIYIFLGGWISLSGMRNRSIFAYGPAWKLEIKDKTAPKSVRIDALARSQASNTRLALLNEAAIQCVRNGFVILLVATLLTASQALNLGSLIANRLAEACDLICTVRLGGGAGGI